MIEGINLHHILIVSTLMFFIGVYGFLVRRNLITILMATELILNSVCINFVAINKFLYPNGVQGYMFTVFIIAIAAAEAAVAIAIIINVYRRYKTINVENIHTMKY